MDEQLQKGITNTIRQLSEGYWVSVAGPDDRISTFLIAIVKEIEAEDILMIKKSSDGIILKFRESARDDCDCDYHG